MEPTPDASSLWEVLAEMHDPEAEKAAEERLETDKALATKILMDSGAVSSVEFSGCMVPLQVFATLTSGEWAYGRNSRVGGDVTCWIFDREYDLGGKEGWPEEFYRSDRVADAWHYEDIAREMVIIIQGYLNERNRK